MKYTKVFVAIVSAALLCSFAADWISFTSKEGRFKLKFPRQPTSTTQEVANEKKPLKMHLFMSDMTKYKDDNLMYYAMYCDYPADLVSSDFRDEIVDTILKGSINGGATNMNGKLLSVTRDDYGTFPGRDAKVDVADGQGICYMHVYLVHSRMYLLMVMCEPKNDGNASMDKFFKSFEITGVKK